MKRFPNLAVAGRELAVRLSAYKDSNNTIVLAIASGGVFVASEVASQLKIQLELLFIRRLLAPFGGQGALCAINVGGTLILDDELPPRPSEPATGMDHSIARAIEQLSERERFCRGARAPVNLSGKNIVLVDNGIHTGSTMLAAIGAVRKLKAGKVTAAVPVADPSSSIAVEHVADEIICLAWPAKFGHVGLWYEEFLRPTEDQILRLYLGSLHRDQEMMNE